MIKYNLNDRVTTDYYETEVFKVVGIRENELELAGDWSGGTHNVCQKSWYPIEKCKHFYNIMPTHYVGQIVQYRLLDEEGGSYIARWNGTTCNVAPAAALIIDWDNGENSSGTAIGLQIFLNNGKLLYKPTVEQGDKKGQWNFIYR